MKRDIQEVLDQCVESILNGTSTLDECILKLDGEMRSEVEPMLFAVQRVVRDGNVEPDPIQKQAGRDHLLKAVDQKRWETGIERTVLLKRQDRKRINKPRKMMMRLAVVMGAMMALSSATVALADQSLPGSPLYPVKRAVENAKISLTLSEDAKKLLYLQAAENRMDELEKLDSDDSNCPGVLDDMADSLTKATSLSGNDVDKDNVGRDGAKNQAVDNTKNQTDSHKNNQIKKRIEAIKKRSAGLLTIKLKLHSKEIEPEIERKLERLGIIANHKAVKKDKGETEATGAEGVAEEGNTDKRKAGNSSEVTNKLSVNDQDNSHKLENGSSIGSDTGIKKENARSMKNEITTDSSQPTSKNQNTEKTTVVTKTTETTVGKRTVVDKDDEKKTKSTLKKSGNEKSTETTDNSKQNKSKKTK